MTTKMTLYQYGMRLRGFSPSCQPGAGLVGRIDSPTDEYYDVLEYSRELSIQELLDYDLDYIGKVEKEVII